MGQDGVEVWRGGVSTWQCDLMGHLNVRFYVAWAVEGLVGLAAALGMTRAFAPRGASTLVVRELHIRFLKEAHAGDALHMDGGLLSIDEEEATALLTLRHSSSGEPSAVFQARLAHGRASDAQSFPWSSAARAHAEGLRVELPAPLAPRSFVPGGPIRAGTLDEADSLRLMRYGAGAFLPEHCDAFGRVAPHLVMSRMTDGAGQGIDAMRRAVGDPRLGMAVVEYRIVYLEWPGAGDRFVTRSGMRLAAPRRMGWLHWMLDPQSGRPWAAAEALLIPLDLDARKAATLPDAAVEALQAHVVPAWREEA